MNTKLLLVIPAAFLLSTVAMAAQTDPGNPGAYQQKTTTTTTITSNHITDAHEVWYKQGGIVPAQYRNNTYTVAHWQAANLTEPGSSSHWVRGASGDFLLVNDSTGEIATILHASPTIVHNSH